MVIRVLVVDDHPVVAQGVAYVLDGDPAAALVGAAETVDEAVRCAGAVKPDVVLLDVRMPDATVVAAVRAILDASSRSAIVLFTGDAQHPSVRGALGAGAVGVVAKNAPPAGLRAVIRDAAAGELSALAGHSGPQRATLTPRQFDVLQCVATGMTNVEIATELGLQPATVKAYWEEAMQRLGVRNRAEAIAAAYRTQLL